MNKNLNEDKEFLVALGKHLIMQIKLHSNKIKDNEEQQDLSIKNGVISTFYYIREQKLENFYNTNKKFLGNN